MASGEYSVNHILKKTFDDIYWAPSVLNNVQLFRPPQIFSEKPTEWMIARTVLCFQNPDWRVMFFTFYGLLKCFDNNLLHLV